MGTLSKRAKIIIATLSSVVVLLVMGCIVLFFIYRRDVKYLNLSKASCREKIDEIKKHKMEIFNDKYVKLSFTQKTIKEGKKRMKNSNVLIVGLGRDIDQILPYSIHRLKDLTKRFKDYRIILYENDSEDNTLIILKLWADEDKKVIILSEDLLEEKAVSYGGISYDRFEKMAYFRNKCLEEVKKPKYKDFDYVIVVDLDLLGGFSVDGISSSFGYDNWDMIAANGCGFIRFATTGALDYYDQLAYRDKKGRRIRGFCVDDICKNAKSFTPNPSYNITDTILYPVTSAFGGLAIYRREIFDICSYAGYDCEHICLHDCMIKHGFDRMFTNPQMVTLQ